MEKKYEPDYQYIDEIYLKKIAFVNDTNSNDVTIFGYYQNPFEDSLQTVDYWCEFSTLTDILLAANEDGDLVITAITDLLNSKDSENPNLIDIENILGAPLKVEDIILKIYKPMEQDEDGTWKMEDPNEAFYLIESVRPKDEFESNKKFIDDATEQLSEYFILLNDVYKHFLHLLELGVPEKAARKKAKLKNDFLFRIATLNYQIIDNEK